MDTQVVLSPLNVVIDPMGTWRLSYFVGLFLMVCVLAVRYREVLYPEVAAMWAFVVVSALWILEFPATPFNENNVAFQATAGICLAEAMLIPLFFFTAGNGVLKFIWKIFPFVVVGEIACVWLKLPGLMTSPAAASLDLVFIALYLPFAPTWLKALSVATIFTHHGSTALLVMLMQLIGLGLRVKMIRWSLLVLAPALVGIAYLNSHGAWFDGLERLRFYQKYMAFWAQAWQFMTYGVGAGSFMFISFMIDHFKPPMNFAMHNDYLQILFEYGAIGLLLTGAIVVRGVRRMWENPKMLAAIFGVLGSCMTYHSLRYFPCVILICFIFRDALYRTED